MSPAAPAGFACNTWLAVALDLMQVASIESYCAGLVSLRRMSSKST